MDSKEFRKIINEYAKKTGFVFMHSGWFKESSECVVVLWLQRSSYSSYYYLNIKIYVRGVFGDDYHILKNLVKDTGDIFTCQPKEYDDLFNLENDIQDDVRKIKLEDYFLNNLKLFSEKALTRSGIKELVDQGEITLLPAVKEELGF